MVEGPTWYSSRLDGRSAHAAPRRCTHAFQTWPHVELGGISIYLSIHRPSHILVSKLLELFVTHITKHNVDCSLLLHSIILFSHSTSVNFVFVRKKEKKNETQIPLIIP